MRRTAFALLAATACNVGAIRIGQRAALTDATTAAPPFTLSSHTGAQVALADGLAAGHVVLVFYRGHW